MNTVSVLGKCIFMGGQERTVYPMDQVYNFVVFCYGYTTRF